MRHHRSVRRFFHQHRVKHNVNYNVNHNIYHNMYHDPIHKDGKTYKTTLILILIWILIGAGFGRSCGNEFLARASANAALGLYNMVAELFVPQAVYASEDAAGGFCEDVVSSVIPSLSYYNKVLWYEAQAESDDYEVLAAAENAAAQEKYADDSSAGSGSSSLSTDELAEIETMAQAASGGSNAADGNTADGSTAADGNIAAGRGAAADGFDVLADLVKVVTVDREDLLEYDYLKSTFYQVDSTTAITAELLDAQTLLAMDMTLEERTDDAPQILIYHTHSQEGYADSVEGDSSTTVVGVGEYLTQLLTEEYGYQVLHHTGEYDVNDRDHAYTNAAPAIEELLEEYSSIQVIIDLHRDGVAESTHLVTEINGKQTAQIMFFNGLSYTTTLGEISWLPNPYIKENLAFSLQMQLAAAEYYPGLTRKIYLKGYRYNMHYLPQSMLVEVGAQTNTLEEAMNAMEPLAALLDYVLSE